MARTSDRQALDPGVRFLLAERDLDDHDEVLDQLNDRVGKMLGLMVGILISTTTAAILLALNLVVQR